MDIAIGKYFYDKKQKKEPFTTSENKEDTVISFLLFVYIVCVSMWSVGTSWHCNTIRGYSTPIKILYSFIAYIFATFYLALHLLEVIKC